MGSNAAHTESSEAATALRAAALSYISHPDNAEQAARAITRIVPWSLTRARFFVSVNQAQIRSLVDRLRPDR